MNYNQLTPGNFDYGGECSHKNASRTQEECLVSSFQCVEGYGGLPQPTAFTDGKAPPKEGTFRVRWYTCWNSRQFVSWQKDPRQCQRGGAQSCQRRRVRGAKNGPREPAHRAETQTQQGVRSCREETVVLYTMLRVGSARQHHAKTLCSAAAAGLWANFLAL